MLLEGQRQGHGVRRSPPERWSLISVDRPLDLTQFGPFAGWVKTMKGELTVK